MCDCNDMLYSGFTPVKRGRPMGSKNKLKETTAPVTVPDTTPVKGKRGRPLGSKNKLKETTTSHVSPVPIKRGRGRPSGTPNKPDHGAGRPSGTPNKPGHAAGGRRTGAGRPVGSKTIKKRGRRSGTKDIHTRKSKKSTNAVIVIQKAWRTRVNQ